MRVFICLLHVICGITQHSNGTGGDAPGMYQYVMTNADQSSSYTGFDPMAVHSIVTENNGYIAIGISLSSETASSKYMGFAVRVDLCSDITQYDAVVGHYLDKPSSNCKNGFTWSFKDNQATKDVWYAWVAGSPDGSYILVAGAVHINNWKHQRYVAKINALTGEHIWSINMPVDDAVIGKKTGYESIAFTQDGGFIVSGFVHNGAPLFEKFSASVANADSMPSTPVAEWTYICDGAAKCTVGGAAGSAKGIRIYVDNGREIVVTAPGGGGAILLVDANTGNEIDFKKFSSGDGDGYSAMDVEVQYNQNGEVEGFVTTGHYYSQIYQDGTDGCPAEGCTKIEGCFTMYSADLSEIVWQTRYGNFPGGQYQYEGLSPGPEALIYTECFGMTKMFDSSKNHVGYLAACGQGIEGCDLPMNQAIMNSCKDDQRNDWRSTTIRIDLDGNLVWYRLDNFKEDDIATVASSAAEYVMTDREGRIVSLTDEAMGFGFLTYQCEGNGNCASTGTTTKPVITTSGTTASTQEPPTTTTGGETTTSKPTAANCLQSRINQFCSANSQYSFARFGEDDLWGCYEKLDKDGEMEYQCVNKDGDDLINCVRYADDSLYTQLDDAIIEEASKGCDDTTTTSPETEETTTPGTTPTSSAGTTTSTTQSVNCLQARLDQWCVDNSPYSFARLSHEEDKWRCYQKLNTDGEMEDQCVNESGDDLVDCIRFADDSLYQNKNNAIIAEAGKGCDVTATTATTTVTSSTPTGETTTTTTTTTATTTTADPCPCMDDSEINYGFTSGLFKYSQIKTLSAGANSLAYAISQTVHDADKVPGMQLEYDGYLVMRKYASCDDTVLAKFADPSVDFHFTDYLCSDCYTTHHTGYHKTDTAAKKRTFTVGYSYSVDDLSNDTNKNGEVDKYVLFITGLQALGVTEQQAYDCVAGAKPSNIWKSSSMIDGCDYSSCVGEKILIW